MAGLTRIELDEAQTPTSEYSLTQANVLSSNASGIFSFCQTGQADLAGSSWDTTVDGSHNFPDFADHGDLYHGDAEDLVMPFGQMTPRQDPSEVMDECQLKWPPAEVKAVKSEPMRRITSRSSAGSSRHKSSKASSKKTHSRMQAILAQNSAQISGLDMAGNAAGYLQDDSMTAGDLMDVQRYLATPDLDALSVTSHVGASPFYPNMVVGMAADGLQYTDELSAAMARQHVNPQVFDPCLHNGSPQSWASLSPVGSRFSSPQAPDGMPDDTWSIHPPGSSPPESYADSTSPPMVHGQSPRNVSHLIAEEPLGMHTSGDDYALPASFGSRRSSGEGESARDHYLYKNAAPQADNLFHCPWEGQANCNHKPEKLKCNYDKFVDSHLKPYRCKSEGCQNTRFSSTACLLRHEREAHAMHGHGEKPYLCNYEGCERAAPGHGFPRQWNLRDHMRRVHNDNSGSVQATTSPSAPVPGPTPAASSKNKKRKNDQEKATHDKTSHRKSTSSSVGHAAPSLVSPTAMAHAEEVYKNALEAEQWSDHRKKLAALVQGFSQPEDAQFFNDYKTAQFHLGEMEKISRMMTPKNTELMQNPYRRSWKQTG